ncbi:MAG: hypothetical protein JNJ77_14150 [Planctomycetia bacterium]|nr:hypothetical protein [Planctomycetia bacterium]
MKLIQTLLDQGMNHQEATNQALKLGMEKKNVARFLANIADAPLIQSHQNEITFLQAYMMLLNVIAIASLTWLGYEQSNQLFYGLAGFAVVIALACWYGISRHRASAYVAVCMLTAMSSMQALRGFQESPAMVSVCIALNLILIGLAIRLKLKLFPQQNFFNNKKCENGNLCY